MLGSMRCCLVGRHDPIHPNPQAPQAKRADVLLPRPHWCLWGATTSTERGDFRYGICDGLEPTFAKVAQVCCFNVKGAMRQSNSEYKGVSSAAGSSGIHRLVLRIFHPSMVASFLCLLAITFKQAVLETVLTWLGCHCSRFLYMNERIRSLRGVPMQVTCLLCLLKFIDPVG